ncbi:DUF5134 domain-containing protein [Dactylosporangium salmoneum]|uniref:DUF5134 domain-containing protein n=1 Tax=Dactylosporangium salmoneum TaxID=53361 RepID=UPI0031D04F92
MLEIAFVAAGGYCLLRCLAARHGCPAMLEDLLHGGMCAAMVAMLAGVPADPWGVQLTVFAVAGAWYAVRLVRSDGGSRRWAAWPQMVMMAAMCWMLLPDMGGAHASMPGMDVPGRASSAITSAVTGSLVLLLGAAAPVWALRSVAANGVPVTPGAPAPRSPFGSAGVAVCQAVMAAAMAAVLAAMLVR